MTTPYTPIPQSTIDYFRQHIHGLRGGECLEFLRGLEVAQDEVERLRNLITCQQVEPPHDWGDDLTVEFAVENAGLEQEIRRLRVELASVREDAAIIRDDIREIQDDRLYTVRQLLNHIIAPGIMSVSEAQAKHVCRVCGKPGRVPFILNYGAEHACAVCIDAERYGKVIQDAERYRWLRNHPEARFDIIARVTPQGESFSTSKHDLDRTVDADIAKGPTE